MKLIVLSNLSHTHTQNQIGSGPRITSMAAVERSQSGSSKIIAMAARLRIAPNGWPWVGGVAKLLQFIKCVRIMCTAIRSLFAFETEILAESQRNQAIQPSIDFLLFAGIFWQFKRIVGSRAIQRTDFNHTGLADRCKCSDGFYNWFRSRRHHLSNDDREEIGQKKALSAIGIRDGNALYCIGWVNAYLLI